MKAYELAVVFRHEAELYKKGLETVREDVTRFGGLIEKEEDLGERVLAYPIKKETSGHYTVFQMKLDPAQVKEFDRHLRLDPNILKFLIIKPENL